MKIFKIISLNPAEVINQVIKCQKMNTLNSLSDRWMFFVIYRAINDKHCLVPSGSQMWGFAASLFHIYIYIYIKRLKQLVMDVFNYLQMFD